MALTPFRGFYDMQGEMNRMFDEVFGSLARSGGRQQGEVPSQWAPALDVLQEDGDIVVRAELPGVRQEEGSGYYVRERRYGSFRRSMSLPQGTDESSIRARFLDGVLEVRVQGAAAVQEPKRIQIDRSGDESGS